MSRFNTKAEYKAIANATAKIIWIWTLLKELKITKHTASSMWCDNLETVYLSTNPELHVRTKYVKVDYHF
jgi:hypothetical protein